MEIIMRIATVVAAGAKTLCMLVAGLLLDTGHAQNSVNVRVMAANLNGNTQSYQPFALRILQGLKPDVVCIQEFNYSNNAASDFRILLDTTLGTKAEVLAALSDASTLAPPGQQFAALMESLSAELGFAIPGEPVREPWPGASDEMLHECRRKVVVGTRVLER